MSGQPRHSHQWAAEALTSVGSRGTLIRGQPRHSHQWALGQPARTTTEMIRSWTLLDAGLSYAQVMAKLWLAATMPMAAAIFQP